MYAPIVLFSYKRLRTLRSTVKSLLENPLAKESVLRIYCDQALNKKEESLVKEVRKYVITISGFKEVEFFFQSSHQGCFSSIINGVSETLNYYDSVIVIEDDLIVSSDFLDFMNCMLNDFKRNPSVFSITGYHPNINIPSKYPYDIYFFPRGSSYGWGTWKDRWKKVDWQVEDFNNFISSSKKINDFTAGGNDLPWLLLMQKKELLDSWAIVWAYSHYKNKALCVFPTKAKVTNLGFGIDATHTKKKPYNFFVPQIHSNSKIKYVLPENIKEDAKISTMVRKIYGPRITNALRFLSVKLKKSKNISKKYPTFIGICNFTFTKPAGLEKRFIRITEGIGHTYDVKCIVSKNIKNILSKEMEVKLTPTSIISSSLWYYIFNCLLKLIVTLQHIPKFSRYIIFYSSSLYLLDLLPAVIGKIINRKSLLIIIVPDEKRISKILNTPLYNFLYVKSMILDRVLVNYFADLIITLDENCKKSLATIYPKCQIETNKLALDYIPQNTHELNQEKYDALFIGRLSISKGVMDLLKIWTKVVSIRSDSKLVIIGPDFDLTKKDLEKLIKNKELYQNIIVKGYISEESLYDTIASSRMLVMPSHYEGFCLPIAEALSLSKPVIAYNLKNLMNIYKEGVLFIDDKDTDAFAKKIIYLLENNDNRISLGNRGNNFIKQLPGWNQIVEKELNLILNIFNNKKYVIHS